MVGEGCCIGWLAFGKAIGQSGGAVRIECVAGEVVVVCGDLCKRAAQRVAGDMHRTIPTFLGQFGCLLGECKGIAEL
ncbi:hypothetical protein D3C75_1244290 [compost metagenome]